VAEPAAAPPAEREIRGGTDPSLLWDACLEAIKGRSIRLWGTLQKAEAVSLGPEGQLVLRVASDFVKQSFRDADTTRILNEVFVEMGTPRRVVLEGDPEAAAKAPTPARPATAPPPAEPAPERSVGQLFKEEPMLQKALDMFEGEVLP
jgi:hypothetical protein